MAVDLFSAGFIEDLRDPVAGDSYNWDGVEPTAAKKSIVIHHSGVNTARANEDGFSIANYHVNNNRWGGVGYHFVITEDGRVQYVGDLSTYRAHVTMQNPGRVGVCLVGNFEEELPKQVQLEATRRLIDFLLAPNNILPSLSYHSQVLYHNEVTGQSTGCPGHKGAEFSQWMGYLKGGVFPHHIYTQPNPPQPTIIETPEIIYETTNPENILEDLPEWVVTWQEEHRKARTKVQTHAFDLKSNTIVADIPQHFPFDIAGTMRANGNLYVRSEYSLTHGTWVGVPADDLEETPIPVKVEETPIETPANVGGGQIDGLSPTPEVPMQAPVDRMSQIGSFFWVLIRLLGKIINRKG